MNSDVGVQVTDVAHLRGTHFLSFLSCCFLPLCFACSCHLHAVLNLQHVLLPSPYIRSFLTPPESSAMAQESGLGKRDFKTQPNASGMLMYIGIT